MGEYERAEEVGADIERTANTVDPQQPTIGKPPSDGASDSDSKEDCDAA